MLFHKALSGIDNKTKQNETEKKYRNTKKGAKQEKQMKEQNLPERRSPMPKEVNQNSSYHIALCCQWDFGDKTCIQIDSYQEY